MDRIDFSKSIDIDPVTQMTEMFNEVMAMYNLVGKYNYASINGQLQKDMNTVSFVVVFETKEEALEVYNTIVNRTVTIYGQAYELFGTVMDKTINLNMRNISLCVPTLTAMI